MISPGDTVKVVRGEEEATGIAIFVKPQSIFVSYPKLGSEWVPAQFVRVIASDQAQWRELLEHCRTLYLSTSAILHQGDTEALLAIHAWLEENDKEWWKVNNNI